MKACNACGTANDDGAEYCSHCGAALVRGPARAGSGGSILFGIFTGFGIAIVYFFVETTLAAATGYLVAGRLCIGPILALGWTLLVITALIYALLNRTINTNLGASYVTATVVTAIAVLVIPIAACTLTALGEISTCKAPAL